MNSPVVKRSIILAGHKTSVSLEDAFWRSVKEIAKGRRVTVNTVIAEIDGRREHGNLSSAVRLYVLDFFRGRSNATQPGVRAAEQSVPTSTLLASR